MDIQDRRYIEACGIIYNLDNKLETCKTQSLSQPNVFTNLLLRSSFTTISIHHHIRGQFKYMSAISVHNHVYFTPSLANNIGVLNTTTNEFSTIPLGPTLNDHWKYWGSILFRNHLYFVPYNSSFVGILDLNTHQFSTIPHPNINPNSRCFRGGIVIYENLYFIPFTAPSIVIWNLLTRTFSTVSIGQHSKCYGSFCSPAHVESKLYLTPYSANVIGVLDIPTNTFHSIPIDQYVTGSSKFDTSHVVHRKIYFIPFSALVIGIYHIDRQVFTTIPLSSVGLESPPERKKHFWASVLYESTGTIVLFPREKRDKVILLDTIRDIISSVKLSTSIGTGTSYHGAVIVGDKIYCCPFDEDSVGVLDMNNIQESCDGVTDWEERPILCDTMERNRESLQISLPRQLPLREGQPQAFYRQENKIINRQISNTYNGENHFRDYLQKPPLFSYPRQPDRRLYDERVIPREQPQERNRESIEEQRQSAHVIPPHVTASSCNKTKSLTQRDHLRFLLQEQTELIPERIETQALNEKICKPDIISTRERDDKVAKLRVDLRRDNTTPTNKRWDMKEQTNESSILFIKHINNSSGVPIRNIPSERNKQSIIRQVNNLNENTTASTQEYIRVYDPQLD